MALRVGSRPFPRVAAAALALTALLMALVALLGAPGASAAARAKPPEITSVKPSLAVVGDRLTIRGRNFRRGKGRNTVVFKRDGGRALFVKADISTTKLMRVVVPSRLEGLLPVKDGIRQYSKFRVRILSARLGRSFTSMARSPRLGVLAAGDADCDADGRINRVDEDDDNDLLTDGLEADYKLIGCDPDTDDDGVGDGYEYASARDLNDDEYQGRNTFLPYPGARPYPNPLDGKDTGTDFDGDSLTLAEEHSLWRLEMAIRVGLANLPSNTAAIDHPALLDKFTLLDSLSYSDGEQYSVRERCPSTKNPDACGVGPAHDGRRVPALPAADYPKRKDFLDWAVKAGYRSVWLTNEAQWWQHAAHSGREEYGLLDVNRSKTPESDPLSPEREDAAELLDFDFDGNDFLSDEERDEDADGLTNFDETRGRMQPDYWTACYTAEKSWPMPYAGTDVTNADSDGDTVRDGADDQDHDDIPNIMELSRIAASGENDRHLSKGGCTPREGLPAESHHESSYGRVNPFNPCLPFSGSGPLTVSRTCQRVRNFVTPPAPFDGSPNWYALQ